MNEARSETSPSAQPAREVRELTDKLAALVEEHADQIDREALAQQLLGPDVCRSLGIYSLPEDFLLSVVIPVFNEVDTVEEVVRRVRATGVASEIILVDDGSTDGTRDILERWRDQPRMKVLFQETNQGKGAAITRGFLEVSGDAVVVQDADLEYDPADYRRLLEPIIDGRADVVFGSRFSGDCQRVLYFWHYVANRMLTTLSNVFTNLNLSDMETCFKVFSRDVIDQLAPTLREKRFGIEPEITSKVARLPGVRVYERPISYSGRTYEQGKKITWKDAVSALRCIIKYR